MKPLRMGTNPQHATAVACAACGSPKLDMFYEVENVPVHSVLLMPTREEALAYPRGDISLAFCEACGFISNTKFDSSKHNYSSEYEETQAFSPTFNAFHHRLALQLIDLHDLRGKKVIEIGCGKGEFLILLCELGGNTGIGFDPSYVEGRTDSEAKKSIAFIKDFYSEKYTSHKADLICCKMTLEHINEPREFIRTVRRSIGDQTDTIVFFQIPDVARILTEQAFWDIYYEHCSYFSIGSLGRLFRSCGFDVLDLWKDYDDQYLMIEAKPATGVSRLPLPQEHDLEKLRADVKEFSDNTRRRTDRWKQTVRSLNRSGKRVVIWGGGSKGVAFLTTLGICDEIEYAVDIDPFKRGTYIAGTGQQIVSPDILKEYCPDTVIVMNPIYCDEIRSELNKMGLNPELMAL
jgi:SAM-dependent methyltransferase